MSLSLSSFRKLHRWVLWWGLLASAVYAQNDAASRREAIEAIYPVMIGAMEAKNFGRARNICEQAIMWEPQNPVHHYNLACIEAQAGGTRLPLAIGELELSIALGFNDPNHMQTDPDLIPIRNDPKFPELLRKAAYNATAGDALASVVIPNRPKMPETSAAAAVEPEHPAPAGFKDGMPVGLYFMTRYRSAKENVEKIVWYFAADGAVYQDLRNGFSAADLKAHAGPRGVAKSTGRSLAITWSDGRQSTGEVERDGSDFTWDMGIFTPIDEFGNRSEAIGVYDGEAPASDGKAHSSATHLELRADGSYAWDGASFDGPDPKSPRVVIGLHESSRGRWAIEGYSLILTSDRGGTLRRFVFPDDDEKTVVKPDRLFFAGVVYKRRP